MARRLAIRLKPEVLRWARERAGLAPDKLAKKVGIKPERVHEWERSGEISMAQVDKLAHHTRTPLGFLFLPGPVDEALPIPDFRTVGDRAPTRASPELLDTIEAMQRRQGWLRDELIEEGQDPLPFVASMTLETPVSEVAASIRETLAMAPGWARGLPRWTEALRAVRDRIEEAGVTAVINGVVGNNTHRKLDPDEFRGFTLVDEFAPFVFVNGADFKRRKVPLPNVRRQFSVPYTDTFSMLRNLEVQFGWYE